jgi:alkylation response protein AidB-like acyl-CoA dehydrogenase
MRQGALFADWVPVAAVDPQERTHMAFIPRSAPGLVVVDDWDGIGQRTTASGSAILVQVRAEANWVVPTWRSFEYPNTFRSFTQLMHAAIDIGIAEGALRACAGFLSGYVSNGPGGAAELARADPVVIHQYGELTVLVRSARALLEQAAEVVDAARAALADPGVTGDSAARWEGRGQRRHGRRTSAR